MRKVLGTILIVLSSLLTGYWIFLFLTFWELILISDIISLVIILFFLMLGIFLVKGPGKKFKVCKSKKKVEKGPSREQLRYQKAQEQKEKRLEETSVKYEDYQNYTESKEDCFKKDLKENADVQYSVEQIFVANRNVNFSRVCTYLFACLYPLGLVILFLAGISECNDFILILALGIFFLCFYMAWIGDNYARRVNARAKLCGFVLAEKREIDNRDTAEKALFYIANTSQISEEMQGLFSFRKKTVIEKKAECEQEERRKERLNYYLDTLESEEFQKKVEQEINHPNNAIEGWVVTPMREAILGREGFFGTKVFFRERRGTQNFCIVYRDFKDYKEIKTLIKNIN